MLRLFGIVVLAATAIAQAPPPPARPAVLIRQDPVIGQAAWVVFIDDLHLDFTATGRIKDLFRTIANVLPQEGDLVAVVSTGPSSIAIDLTRDRKRLDSALAKISGAGLKAAEAIFDLSGGQSSETQYRAHVAFDTAHGVLKTLAQVPSPHKAFIYISNGYPVDLWAGTTPPRTINPFDQRGKNFTEDRLRAEVAELTEEATRANVAIYAINAAALLGPRMTDPPVKDVAAWERYVATTRKSLEVIAEGAGGFAIQDDLEGGLIRIASAVRHR